MCLLQCILVGDSEGQVSVYQLRGMPDPPPKDQQVKKDVFLHQCLDTNTEILFNILLHSQPRII